MFHTSFRNRGLALILPVWMAVASASCSSDTRAILAPDDALLSLKAGGPLIANQGVEITVSAAKADGSAVSDGTEIQFTANAGEFQSAKVRTQGGQATTTYVASGPGAVELVAASDDVKGQLNLVAASAAPSRLNLSVSSASVPDGGGQVEVTATVLGASNEPVVSAPVEFFTSNGSFAPAGTMLTNDQGQVTASLSTPDATQVRARVHSIESNSIQIAVLAPLRKGDDSRLPFRMSDVVYLNANVSELEVTSEVTDVRIDRNTICIEHTKAGRWPRRGIGEGNPWVFARIDGTWYAATYEYLRSGQTCKHIERRGDWGIGPHTKRPPLEGWAPRQGELVGFMVSTFARDSTRTSNERSNVWMMEWPY